MERFAHPIGRIFLGLLFAMSGFGKITQMGAAGFGGYIESVLPGMGLLAWPVMLFELLAGIALIIGFQTRLISLALVAFCIFTGVLFHGSADMTGLLKNVALAGGYLMLFGYGSGIWSVDNRQS